jgi:hypothetical protein
MPKTIKSIDELKQIAANEDGMECFISLAGGIAKSSKLIKYHQPTDKFYIINYIDDTTQELKPQQLFNKQHTNIGEAIQKNCLFAYC